MATSPQVTSAQDGLTLTAYAGNGAVLLAFDLAPERTPLSWLLASSREKAWHSR